MIALAKYSTRPSHTSLSFLSAVDKLLVKIISLANAPGKVLNYSNKKISTKLGKYRNSIYIILTIIVIIQYMMFKHFYRNKTFYKHKCTNKIPTYYVQQKFLSLE